MTNPIQTSHVHLDVETKQALVSSLNTVLATTMDLQFQVKQAHWNIKGPQFFARHELFDKLAEKLRGFSDEVAERASTLGGYANGTVRLAAGNSKLEEYNLDAREGTDHLRTLVGQYATYTKLLRSHLKEAGPMDPITEDLYVEVLRTAELDMWFLESHINA